MSYDLQQSLSKLLSYAYKISKEPVTFEVGGKVESHPLPDSIKISPKFYRSFACVPVHFSTCGKQHQGSRCCKTNFWNVMTVPEFEKMSSIYTGKHDISPWKQMACKVNGKEFPIWVEDHSTEGMLCQNDGGSKGCLIHEASPTHCRVPLIKFKAHNDSVYITKEQFGRNWKFGCPIPATPLPRKEFEEWDLGVFTNIKKVSEYFEIPTYIDEVIEKLKEGYEMYDKKQEFPHIIIKGKVVEKEVLPLENSL